MSAQLQPESEEALLLALDALRQQKFQTSGLRDEQDLLLYFCLQSLWQLLNNAYQGDGRAFLSSEQTRLLQLVDGHIDQLEARLPPALVLGVQHCLRRYLAAVDEAQSDNVEGPA